MQIHLLVSLRDISTGLRCGLHKLDWIGLDLNNNLSGETEAGEVVDVDNCTINDSNNSTGYKDNRNENNNKDDILLTFCKQGPNIYS